MPFDTPALPLPDDAALPFDARALPLPDAVVDALCDVPLAEPLCVPVSVPPKAPPAFADRPLDVLVSLAPLPDVADGSLLAAWGSLLAA